MDSLTTPASLGEALRTQLNLESELMIAYALSSGKELPQSIVDALDLLEREVATVPSLAVLAGLHTALSRLVAPATPRGIKAIRLDAEQHPALHRIGAVPSLRYLLFAAFGFAWMFFLTSLNPGINPGNLAKDIYTSSGWDLALVMTFLLSAAGIGVSFGALFEVFQSVSDRNYDPAQDGIYWVRIGIGLIAGLMLAQLIPFPQGTAASDTLTRPLLALIGGYSASVVHRILERLVTALESIFIPQQGADPAAAERDLRQRLAEEQSRQLKTFDKLLGQVSAAGGTVGDVRSELMTLLPGGVSSALAGKATRLALDAGIGLMTGGIKGASEKVVEDLVGNAGDVAAAAVRNVLPASGALAGLAGTAASLVARGAMPGTAQGQGDSGARAIADAVGTVTTLFRESGKADGQVKEVSAIDVARTLGAALLSGSPVGFVSALITVGCKLGEAEYQRWKARVLAAPYRPEFLPPASINSASAVAAMRLSPVFGRAFKPEVEAGDRLKLQEIAQCAAGPDEAFRTAFATRFASEAACTEGLREFRQVLLDRRVLNDASGVLQDGMSASGMLEAADSARADPEAAEGLGAVMQTLDQARAENWDENRTTAEVDARLQAPTEQGP
nr:hypothetical protein [uncultured Rhodopila sp.]